MSIVKFLWDILVYILIFEACIIGVAMLNYLYVYMINRKEKRGKRNENHKGQN